MTPIEVVNERHTGAKGECGHFVVHSLLLAEGESGLPRESILSCDPSVMDYADSVLSLSPIFRFFT